MSELHDRFGEWLLSGAPGEPSRDAALHASACDRCLADLGALDALLAIDVAGADVPILPAGATARLHRPGGRALRALGGVTAAGLLLAAAATGIGALAETGPGSGIAVDPPASPDGEGILAGAPSLEAPAASLELALPSSRPSPDATVEASAAPSPTQDDTGPADTQPPFAVPPPPTVTPAPTISGTPRPTTGVTPAPTIAPTAPPSPTPEPTPATPEPTSEPTPTALPPTSEPEPEPSEEAAP